MQSLLRAGALLRLALGRRALGPVRPPQPFGKRDAWDEDALSSKGGGHTSSCCYPVHCLSLQMFRVLDEVLSRGPGRMSGGLDSLHRADYGAHGGLVSAEVLHHGEAQPVTSLRYFVSLPVHYIVGVIADISFVCTCHFAFRLVVDMADGLCYDGMVPHGQSNRPLDSLLSSADRLQRWSSPDPAVAYERFCLPSKSTTGSAEGASKEEL